MTDTDTQAPKVLEPRILTVLRWPDDRLHEDCEDITEFDSLLEQFALDMFATMKSENGIGLAAPQVAVASNVITIWIESNKPLFLANPEIIEASDEDYEWDEGCLSVPGYFEKRKRPNRIVVRYKNVKGEEHETEFRNLYAFAIQHEIDHLRGKLFIDDLSVFKKTRVRSKVQKYLKKNK